MPLIPVATEAHRGVLVMVLGIVGISLSGVGLLVFAPLCFMAWRMGRTDLEKMAAGLMDPRGESQTRAGYLCGLVGVVLVGIILALLLVAAALILVLFFLYSGHLNKLNSFSP